MVDEEGLAKDLNRAFDAHSVSALIFVAPFAEMLVSNPDKAIDMIPQVYNEALNDAYGKNRSYVEALAGGPMETIPWALYNSVGEVYPNLTRFQRDRALKHILSILDKRNYMEVNGAIGVGHTTGIREPLLLSDIAIIYPLYWPGLDEGRVLIKEASNFFDFQKEFIDSNGLFVRGKVEGDPILRRGVNSDFVMAYSLLRADICDFGESYIRIANPGFLERTLKGIVAMRFARATDEEKIEQGRKRLKELLPESVHNRIEPLRQERDWVDYTKFR